MWRHERESLGSAELDEDRIVGVVAETLDGDLGWAARCGRVNRRCVHGAHLAIFRRLAPKVTQKRGHRW